MKVGIYWLPETRSFKLIICLISYRICDSWPANCNKRSCSIWSHICSCKKAWFTNQVQGRSSSCWSWMWFSTSHCWQQGILGWHELLGAGWHPIFTGGSCCSWVSSRYEYWLQKDDLVMDSNFPLHKHVVYIYPLHMESDTDRSSLF